MNRAGPPPLADLFRQHACGLAGAARGVLGHRADTREVLQDVYLKAHRALEAGMAPSDPVGWLFVMTLNRARDLRRRERRRAGTTDIEEIDEMQLSQDTDTPARAAERGERVQAARDAIERLEDPLKDVFLLRVSGELGFEAVSELLRIPVGTAKTRMRSALAQLRMALGAHEPSGTGDLR